MIVTSTLICPVCQLIAVSPLLHEEGRPTPFCAYKDSTIHCVSCNALLHVRVSPNKRSAWLDTSPKGQPPKAGCPTDELTAYADWLDEHRLDLHAREVRSLRSKLLFIHQRATAALAPYPERTAKAGNAVHAPGAHGWTACNRREHDPAHHIRRKIGSPVTCRRCLHKGAVA